MKLITFSTTSNHAEMKEAYRLDEFVTYRHSFTRLSKARLSIGADSITTGAPSYIWIKTKNNVALFRTKEHKILPKMSLKLYRQSELEVSAYFWFHDRQGNPKTFEVVESQLIISQQHQVNLMKRIETEWHTEQAIT